jgi:hypothetical protein
VIEDSQIEMVRPESFREFVSSVAAGSHADVRLVLGASPSGARVASPVRIVRAATDGPTLFVMSGVHGDEAGGPLGLRLFMDELGDRLTAGTLIACFVANVPAFEHRARCSLWDATDLVRVWPGRPDGTVTEQIANGLATVVRENAEALVDLHCGTPALAENWVLYANSRSPIDTIDEAVETRSLDLAKAFGADQIIRGHPWLTTVSAFGSLGVPTILAEIGGGPDWYANHESYLTQMSQGLSGVLAHLGMANPPSIPRSAGDQFDIAQELIAGQVDGLWQPVVRPGDQVTVGQEVGAFVNPATGHRSLVIAQAEGTVMNPMCTWPHVEPRQWLAAVGVRA